MTYEITENEIGIALSDRTICGREFVPAKTGKLPAVILSHGYNSCMGDMADMGAALARCGVYALCYDFCGGSTRSKSSGSPLDMSIESEIADLNVVIESVLAGGNVDESQLYLYGESQGGFVSALAADERIKGLLLLYPALCIPDDWAAIIAKGMPETYDLMGMTLSRKFCEGLPKYDVFEKFTHYSGQVHIFHGTADGLVNIGYSERAVKCFANADLTCYDGEGHGFSPAARAKLVEQVCGYFE